MVFNIRICLCQTTIFLVAPLIGVLLRQELQEAKSGLPSTGVKCFQIAAWPAEVAIFNSYTIKVMHGSQPK